MQIRSAYIPDLDIPMNCSLDKHYYPSTSKYKNSVTCCDYNVLLLYTFALRPFSQIEHSLYFIRRGSTFNVRHPTSDHGSWHGHAFDIHR